MSWKPFRARHYFCGTPLKRKSKVSKTFVIVLKRLENTVSYYILNCSWFFLENQFYIDPAAVVVEWSKSHEL